METKLKAENDVLTAKISELISLHTEKENNLT